MPKEKWISQITEQLNGLLGALPDEEFKKNLRAVLNGWLQKVQIATREELEIQSQVLARTRETLLQLESRVEQLEIQRSTAVSEAAANPTIVDSTASDRRAD